MDKVTPAARGAETATYTRTYTVGRERYTATGLKAGSGCQVQMGLRPAANSSTPRLLTRPQ